jgi:hypothetical protein
MMSFGNWSGLCVRQWTAYKPSPESRCGVVFLGRAVSPARQLLIGDAHYAPPRFKARLGFKDIHLALGAAEALEVPMPVASLLRDRFLALQATGAGDLDWSALAALASRDAGEPSSLLAAK